SANSFGGTAATPAGKSAVPTDPLSEAIIALQQLGYRPAEALRMAEKAHTAGDSVETIIRQALKSALR
ncbi:MAG TPA: Holliday junction branch migration protein RuvA, partial [Xanthomonadaceae bacterium]|nr:Holliday junction branch migration protein RuvA [Xanthomonadaceae bacterium]